MAEEEPVDPQIEGEGEGGAAEEFPGETEAEAPLEAEEGAEPPEGDFVDDAHPEGGEGGDYANPEEGVVPGEGGEEFQPEQYGEEGALPADDSNNYGGGAEYDPAAGEEAPADGYGGGEFEQQAEYDPLAEAPADGGYGAVDAYGENAYGASDPEPYAADAYGADAYGAAAATAPGGDVDRLLAAEREKHEQQLKMETQAREELEDMILRIEKHFKAEQAARKKAEELLQSAIGAEMDAKNKLEDIMRKRQQEQKLLDEERGAITRERTALESMRQEFESELQAARSEVAKAQEALAGSEERIRAAEQVERTRLEGDYQAKLVAMQAEIDRTREEMNYRTMVMQDEMEKWRQQAHMTANAVLEAKNEVMERKRELDSTKEKMDRLLDKLLIGRERGIELSGAIASNQRMMSMMQQGGMQSLPPMGHKGPMQGGGPQGSWMAAPQQAAAGRPVKLPPVDLSPPHKKAPPRRSRSQHDLDGGASYQDDGGQYAYAQSKVFQSAAEAGLKAKPKSGKKKNSKPDRFEEAQKDAMRNAAMARW